MRYRRAPKGKTRVLRVAVAEEANGARTRGHGGQILFAVRQGAWVAALVGRLRVVQVRLLESPAQEIARAHLSLGSTWSASGRSSQRAITSTAPSCARPPLAETQVLARGARVTSGGHARPNLS